jgi:hypothetical protein
MANARIPVVLVLLLSVAPPVQAQALRLDLTAANRHLWRGVNRTTDWVAQLWDLVHAHRGDAPYYPSPGWEEAVERSELFGPLQLRHFRHEQALTPDDVVRRAASISYVAALPDDER